MRIFMTGGSGFIGREIARLALNDGHLVANFDLVAPDAHTQVPFWKCGDVRDYEALSSAVSEFQPDIVIHLASDTDVSVEKIENFTTTINGTTNVIRIVDRLSELKKFVHISTQFTVRPGVAPPNETYLEPYTVYGEAKAETERLVRNAELKMPWLIIRPTIIWGPHHPSFREAIFKHIRTRTYLHPTGTHKIMRAFGYVTNTAQQIITLALSDPSETGNQHVFYAGDATLDYDIWADAFSVGLTGKPARRVPTSLLILFGRVGDLLKIVGIRPPIDSGRAFRMSTGSAIDLSTTLTLTGPVPVSFEQGVKQTLTWLN